MLPLYAWLRRHPMLVDGLLALFIALLGAGQGARDTAKHGPVSIVVLLLLVVPIVFRRKHPVGAFATVIAAGALEVAVLPGPVGSDFAVLVTLYTLAAYRPRRISVPGLAVCLGGSAIAIAAWLPWQRIKTGSGVFALCAITAVFFGPAVLAWAVGDSMRWRRGYYRALEERAARLEAERDAQTQIAAATERARIARELHDVIAHNVSVMVVQADGASYALDEHPERTREALTAISHTGRQALAEMRHMLGVLRSASQDQGSLAPQPGLEQIAELLSHSRAAGLPVSFAVEGVPRALPPGIALAAYRVVQESLTNTRKHGGAGVTARVALRFCEDGLKVEVRDDGRGVAAFSDGAGHGLIGMRERVEMYGGTVSAAPGTTGYTVIATIPFTEPGPTDSGPAVEPAKPRRQAPPGAPAESGGSGGSSPRASSAA